MQQCGITGNLKRVLSIPDGKVSEIETVIGRIMVEMEQELEFAENGRS